MDYSSLSESQQQLLAQYQQYQQQQQQQQQQEQPQQQPQQQQYDPSQAQAYDPTAQAYYPYAQPYQTAASHPYQQYPQQQSYPYYPPDYGTTAAANAYQQPPQPDPNPQPHGHAVPPEASQMLAAAAGGQPQQSAYVPQDQQGSYPVPPGLNPAAAAAVAALSQLTQFAGTMDAAERAVAGMQERQWQDRNGGYGQVPGHPPMQHGAVPFHPNAGRPPYRGGGRRGGGPYRGGGRSGHRPPRPDGGAPPFRGRGRMGRGGGRRFQPPAAAPSPYPGPASALEQPSAAFPAPVTAPASKSAKAQRRPPQVFWCEICRVDCNSLEILERHKNGKRHKKTLERSEELQKHKKLESESKPMVIEQPENVQGGEDKKPENVQGGEDNKPATENHSPKCSAPEDLLAVVNADENKTDLEQQKQVAEQSEVEKADPTEAPTRKRKMDRFDNRRFPGRGGKMKFGRGGKMKFGRGGKRIRPFEAVRSPEPPKELPTRYCALCNVTCDTPAVFECHLAGKKHASRAKRFPGPQGGYGAMGFHAPYMPHARPPDFNPQGPPAEGDGNHQAQQAVLGTQAQQDSEPQGQEVAPNPEGKEAVMTQNESGDAVMAESEGQNTFSEFGGKDTIVTQDNAVPTLENAISGTGNICMPVEDAVPAPEYGVPLADNVILPGLDVKAEENGSKNEELTSHGKESQ